MTVKKKALLAALLFSLSYVLGMKAQAENLKSALSKAYNFNRQLNYDRVSVQVSRENVLIARSANLPIIDIFASYTRSNSPVAPYYSSIGSVGIQLQQKIFDGFVAKNTISATEMQVFAQQEYLKNSEQNQLFAAVQAYADLFAAQQIASLRRDNLAFLNEQVRSDQAKFDVGEGTRTDLAQAQAQRAQAISQLHLALADVKSYEANYQKIIGTHATFLEPPVTASGLPTTEQEGYKVAKIEHPALLYSQYMMKAAAYSVKANEGALLPQINFNVSSAYNQIYDGPGSNGRANSIGFTLTVPFFEAGRTSAQIRQSKEQYGLAQIQVDIYLTQIRQQLTAAFSQYQGARASVLAYRDSVSANKIALEGRKQEQKVGQATTLDVLNTRSMLLDSQIGLVTAQKDQVIASYALLVAMGRMTAQQLKLPLTFIIENRKNEMDFNKAILTSVIKNR